LPNNANCSNMFYTNEKSELLVLTNDKKIQTFNYKENNRIPIDGVKLSGNGGTFTDNKDIKKYFEECVYTPEKIKLSEFEKFKQENRPVRTEFATTFVSWEPEQDEPKNPTNVLDLGSLTYEAKWEDPNWDFTETDKSITLKRYKGKSNEINIPTFANGKNFVINSKNLSFPSTTTKVICRPGSSGSKTTYQPIDMSGLFLDLSNLIEVDLTGLEVSNVSQMNGMFWECSNLTKVNVSDWNTSNVNRMDGLFYGCNNLTEVDLSNWNTSNVVQMNGMFWGCSNLTKINVSDWNTSNVNRMDGLFYGCNNLTEVDLSNWNTSNVVQMNGMFYECSNLKNININNFDVRKVTKMDNMFKNVPIETLDL
ncbi:BspA family leucine-rich repeat surface protein, partial [Enterococcus faecium]|nr:BspA family leucine-rich repeat surface protein [Enterococcus faecium]